MTIWLIGFFIIFVAAFVQGITGFGFGLIAIPVLFYFYDPREVIFTILIMSFFYYLILSVQVRKGIEMKVVIPLFICSVLGMPLGVVLYNIGNMIVFKTVAGCVVIAFVLLQIFIKKTHQIKREKLGLSVIGFLSGIFTTSIGINGPPVIFFFQNQKYSIKRIRNNIIGYFLLIYPISIIMLYFFGSTATVDVTLTFTFLPALLGGMWVGIKLYAHISAHFFNKVVLYLLLLSGVSLIISNYM